MIKIKKLFPSIILLFSSLQLLAQQLPQYSQYLFNSLHVNPAYAGYKNIGYVQSTYRSQWINFPGAPKTLSVTADLSASEGMVGFGVSFVDDQIGPTANTMGQLTLARRVRMGYKSFLSFGLSGGISRYKLDPNLFNTFDFDDPLIPEERINKTVPNLNSGLFFHSDDFYLGLSLYNMIGSGATKNEDVALAYHDFHYFFTTGALFKLSDEVKLKPSVLVKHVKGNPMSYDLNVMFLLKDRLWLGGSFRSNVRSFENNLKEDLIRRNAVATILEIFATPNLRLGYAYDYNLNVLNSYRNNSHEVSMGYYLKSKIKIMKNPRWF